MHLRSTLHRYLTMKIMEEGASQMIECPGDCKIIVDDKMVVLEIGMI